MADNETNDSRERRRSERIRATTATFSLHSAGGAPLSCEVLNLSRLGFGMELPSGADPASTDALRSGSALEGDLHVAGDSLHVKAEVRVRKGAFLGLEYSVSESAFLRRLRALLTPEYVAASIHAIAPEFLGADIRASYQSDDFECTIFKPGVTGHSSMVQLYWDGKVVEVAGDQARFVPPLLVRGSGEHRGRISGAELLRAFNGFNDDGTDQELAAFFRSLARLIAAWPACPIELQGLLKKQLAQKA